MVKINHVSICKIVKHILRARIMAMELIRIALDKTGFKVWFSNADDETIEGIEHKSKPIIAVQFHPEASPGPYDCMFVFDRFKELIEQEKKTAKINRIS